MSKRITIMLDESHERKIRQMQAKQIQKTNMSYSFSQCLNDLLDEVLR